MALSRTISRLFNRGVTEVWEERPVVPIVWPIIKPATLAAHRVASRFLRFPTRTRNNPAGRVILGITDNHDSPSAAFNLIALRNALHRIVRPLGMEIRTDFADEGAHVILWENYDRIHIRQRRQNFRTFFGRDYPPALALQCPHGNVRIHRDNQSAAESTCRVQVANMPNVQHIEAPVRQRDAIAGAPPFRHTLAKLVSRNNFLPNWCAQRSCAQRSLN